MPEDQIPFTELKGVRLLREVIIRVAGVPTAGSVGRGVSLLTRGEFSITTSR